MQGGIPETAITVVRKSFDARKRLKWVYIVDVETAALTAAGVRNPQRHPQLKERCCTHDEKGPHSDSANTFLSIRVCCSRLTWTKHLAGQRMSAAAQQADLGQCSRRMRRTGGIQLWSLAAAQQACLQPWRLQRLAFRQDNPLQIPAQRRATGMKTTEAL